MLDRFPNSQFSSRKSWAQPSQGARPFIKNHLDCLMLKGKYTYLIRQNLSLDELFISFVHAVRRLQWEISPNLIYFIVWFPLVELTVKLQNLWGRSLAGGDTSLGRAWRSHSLASAVFILSCPPLPTFLYGDEIGALCFLCLPACTLAFSAMIDSLPLEL